MPLFDIAKQNLVEISEVTFDLEKEIQRLVENNMKTIFNLDFITSEFELNGFRIDSLGFDQESNSFTIIEYKKDRNFSVIDQGYAYLSLLLNNKAEYILKFNENKKRRIFEKRRCRLEPIKSHFYFANIYSLSKKSKSLKIYR